MSALTLDDVATLLESLRGTCSLKTAAGALATLHSIIRYARRHSWIALDPVDQLEPHERPRPARRRQRVLGREEIERLLVACRPRDRLMVATALHKGLRISELLGLTWGDVDFDLGVIYVRAQLSRAHRGAPPGRVRTKTEASVRDIPLVPQLADMLAEHRLRTPFAAGTDWVFVSANGTPHGERNVTRRGLQRAARGHASPTITLNVYTHLFDDARHTREIRARMTASPFARLLEPPESTLVEMPMKLRHMRATV